VTVIALALRRRPFRPATQAPDGNVTPKLC